MWCALCATVRCVRSYPHIVRSQTVTLVVQSWRLFARRASGGATTSRRSLAVHHRARHHFLDVLIGADLRLSTPIAGGELLLARARSRSWRFSVAKMAWSFALRPARFAPCSPIVPSFPGAIPAYALRHIALTLCPWHSVESCKWARRRVGGAATSGARVAICAHSLVV